MKLMTEETLGPVMPVMKFCTVDEAVALANDGLLTALMREAEKNSFEGWRVGGSRLGPAGLTRFLRSKVIIRQTGRPATIGVFDEANASR